MESIILILLGQLNRMVPEFEVEKDLLEAPTIIFGMFGNFIIENTQNDELIQRCLAYIELMYSQNSDESLIGAWFDELVFGMYDRDATTAFNLIKRLSTQARSHAEYTLHLWIVGNKKHDNK
jgi:hypothetical protein